MAILKARRIKGNNYTSEDTLELQLTLDGDDKAKECVNYVEVVSGSTITHGGGVPAETRLHYKAVERDADGNGIIDYSSSNMDIVQAEKGTSVVKVVAEVLLKSEYDLYVTEYAAWLDEYVTSEEGEELVIVEGAPNAPAYPSPKVYKSGEITLTWQDDTFV